MKNTPLTALKRGAYMYIYKVRWVDHDGEKHESVVKADALSEAEIKVWEANTECLGIEGSYQIS